MTNKELLTMVYEAKNSFDSMNILMDDDTKYYKYSHTGETIIRMLNNLGFNVDVVWSYDFEKNHSVALFIVIQMSDKRVYMACHSKKHFDTIWGDMLHDMKASTKNGFKVMTVNYTTMTLKKW